MHEREKSKCWWLLGFPSFHQNSTFFHVLFCFFGFLIPLRRVNIPIYRWKRQRNVIRIGRGNSLAPASAVYSFNSGSVREKGSCSTGKALWYLRTKGHAIWKPSDKIISQLYFHLKAPAWREHFKFDQNSDVREGIQFVHPSLRWMDIVCCPSALQMRKQCCQLVKTESATWESLMWNTFE